MNFEVIKSKYTEKDVKSETGIWNREVNNMEESRLIPKFIYHSRTFLKLPVTAQNLMTFLILNSDNNGIVMAYAVMRMINASDDDLRLLEERGFVYVLNENFVTYITGFQEFMNECEKTPVQTVREKSLL